MHIAMPELTHRLLAGISADVFALVRDWHVSPAEYACRWAMFHVVRLLLHSLTVHVGWSIKIFHKLFRHKSFIKWNVCAIFEICLGEILLALPVWLAECPSWNYARAFRHAKAPAYVRRRLPRVPYIQHPGTWDTYQRLDKDTFMQKYTKLT